MDKLAAFMDMSPLEVKAQLEGLREVNRVVCHPGGDAPSNLDGTERSVADLEFKIEKSAGAGAGGSGSGEIIHIEDKGKGQRRYQEVLVRHINRFQEITASLTA